MFLVIQSVVKSANLYLLLIRCYALLKVSSIKIELSTFCHFCKQICIEKKNTKTKIMRLLKISISKVIVMFLKMQIFHAFHRFVIYKTNISDHLLHFIATILSESPLQGMFTAIQVSRNLAYCCLAIPLAICKHKFAVF